MGVEPRGRAIGDGFVRATGKAGRSRVDHQTSKNKPFAISKWEVWQAYQRVKANKGAAGVDGCSVEAFETDLRGNLYKIWNRMSSGTWFPPPVRAVPIPKAGGQGVRMLGVPTVADRIAQTVVAGRLEQRVEQIFHTDSDGYRVGRSAIDAVAKCRQRCWSYDWVLDLDIQAFFDSVPHDLLVRAVEANTDQPWVVLYIRRWLQAPLQHPDGTLHERDRGTPQGSAVSPVLANLFLHYGFDTWMAREFPGVRFERYVDDIVVHCTSQQQARWLQTRIDQRLVEVGLRLHPAKTRIVCVPRARKERLGCR
jgi:RNA-directed DNA polymerase